MNMGYKMGVKGSFFELLNGDVCVWVEPEEGIYMRAGDSKSRDPVELTSEMAKELAVALLEMVAQLED
jgi:hypothetical protein